MSTDGATGRNLYFTLGNWDSFYLPLVTRPSILKDTTMDQKLVDHSIDFHGPELIDQLANEQVDVALPNFLSLSSQGSCCHENARDPAFTKKLAKFIAKKADLVFRPPSIPVTALGSIEEEAHVAVLPPLDCFMEVPGLMRKEYLYKSLMPGDLIVGNVASVQESGLSIALLCLDGGKARDLEQLKILAFCPLREIPKYYSHESPLEAFALKDTVRGVVLHVAPESEKIVFSMQSRALPPGKEQVKVGLLAEEELPLHYMQAQKLCGRTYEECLGRTLEFSNPSNVQCLAPRLGIVDDQEGMSLMRGLHSVAYKEEDYAENLRQAQSYRLALRSVAEGIRFFKEGRHMEAMQHLNKALQVDEKNVEALVARGALYANNESFKKAIDDFEAALKLNPNHKNARKYISETLIAQGRSLMDAGDLDLAAPYLTRVLELEPENQDAAQGLQEIKAFARNHPKKGDDIGSSGSRKVRGSSFVEDDSADGFSKAQGKPPEVIDVDRLSRSAEKRKRTVSGSTVRSGGSRLDHRNRSRSKSSPRRRSDQPKTHQGQGRKRRRSNSPGSPDSLDRSSSKYRGKGSGSGSPRSPKGRKQRGKHGSRSPRRRKRARSSSDSRSGSGSRGPKGSKGHRRRRNSRERRGGRRGGSSSSSSSRGSSSSSRGSSSSSSRSSSGSPRGGRKGNSSRNRRSRRSYSRSPDRRKKTSAPGRTSTGHSGSPPGHRKSGQDAGRGSVDKDRRKSAPAGIKHASQRDSRSEQSRTLGDGGGLSPGSLNYIKGHQRGDAVAVGDKRALTSDTARGARGGLSGTQGGVHGGATPKTKAMPLAGQAGKAVGQDGEKPAKPDTKNPHQNSSLPDRSKVTIIKRSQSASGSSSSESSDSDSSSDSSSGSSSASERRSSPGKRRKEGIWDSLEDDLFHGDRNSLGNNSSSSKKPVKIESNASHKPRPGGCSTKLSQEAAKGSEQRKAFVEVKPGHPRRSLDAGDDRRGGRPASDRGQQQRSAQPGGTHIHVAPFTIAPTHVVVEKDKRGLLVRSKWDSGSGSDNSPVSNQTKSGRSEHDQKRQSSSAPGLPPAPVRRGGEDGGGRYADGKDIEITVRRRASGAGVPSIDFTDIEAPARTQAAGHDGKGGTDAPKRGESKPEVRVGKNGKNEEMKTDKGSRTLSSEEKAMESKDRLKRLKKEMKDIKATMKYYKKVTGMAKKLGQSEAVEFEQKLKDAKKKKKDLKKSMASAAKGAVSEQETKATSTMGAVTAMKAIVTAARGAIAEKEATAGRGAVVGKQAVTAAKGPEADRGRGGRPREEVTSRRPGAAPAPTTMALFRPRQVGSAPKPIARPQNARASRWAPPEEAARQDPKDVGDDALPEESETLDDLETFLLQLKKKKKTEPN